MSNFRKFQSIVKSKGGIWAGDKVVFSQMRDIYTAEYKPDYPNNSPHDQTLEFNHSTNTWQHYGANE